VSDDGLLDEQQAYYRRRAPSYDEWFERRGPYDRGPEENRRWLAEVDVVAAALDAWDLGGDVLELAGGTGWWTQRLAGVASTLTVVDGSSETLELNRARVGRDDISYVVADLFTWEAERAQSYDVVFFSFWLSHVPRERVAAFFALVARCLRPGGRAVFIDNRHDPKLDVPDPYVTRYGTVVGGDGDVQVRRLGDGTEHRVVKVFYEPAELQDRLAELGWRADVRATESSFIYGTASPESDR
jgi:demethylmenaquinone methyltransferase/2-methoxy-6-polyprenyl-1,4-benzoquinol methylase